MNIMLRLASLTICTYFCLLFPIMACADNTLIKVDISSSQVAAVEQATALHQNTSTASIDSKHPQADTNGISQVNVSALKKRLRKTHAIGFFTKLAIHNDIVDLTNTIERYRKKSLLADKLKEIRASFDGLLLKIVALLDEDPDLSRDLYVGREQIWQSLLEEV